jgi:hypothetical protein
VGLFEDQPVRMDMEVMMCSGDEEKIARIT